MPPINKLPTAIAIILLGALIVAATIIAIKVEPRAPSDEEISAYLHKSAVAVAHQKFMNYFWSHADTPTPPISFPKVGPGPMLSDWVYRTQIKRETPIVVWEDSNLSPTYVVTTSGGAISNCATPMGGSINITGFTGLNGVQMNNNTIGVAPHH
jgi:hypothetical protein